jgi:hypothetical protein
MYLSYFDECGDDGYPAYSSEVFILTSIYFNYSFWKSNYEKIYALRKQLKTDYGLPIKEEFHTREFIQDKNPYHGKYTAAQRKEILFKFCRLIPEVKIRIINVAIDKKKINNANYNVLKNALTYNVQRIENDLNSLLRFKNPRFMIFTDEGRVGKMRSTVRSIQKINYIPSHYSIKPYRREIQNMIEDVLPKKSSESYFIQIADMISFIVSLYVKQNKCDPKIAWGKRVKTVLSSSDEIALMEILKPKLNLKASGFDRFGVVCYPK